MVRIARAVAIGVPHHVTQRGNNRQDVFAIDGERERYISYLKEQSKRYHLTVHSYCLMSNHVHLVVVPANEDSLSKTLGRTHFSYAQYFNRLNNRSGHLWQARFYSCPLAAMHYWATVRYVERNPVRAGIVRDAWCYPWSSAKAHVTGHDSTGLLDMSTWCDENIRKDWKTTLQSTEDVDELIQIRNSNRTGRPLGSDGFISELERNLNRRLRAMPKGRPWKRE